MSLSPRPQRSAPSTGTLLERFGGTDAVKRVAETFTRKLYADAEVRLRI
jgi:hypothetical protein